MPRQCSGSVSSVNPMQRSCRKSQSSALCVNASSCRSAAASAPSVPGLIGSQETVCWSDPLRLGNGAVAARVHHHDAPAAFAHLPDYAVPGAVPGGAACSRFRRRSAEHQHEPRIGGGVELAAAGVERAGPVHAADHGVDLRIRVVVVVAEEAAEAVHQPLERVGGGARLPGGVGQVDGLVAVFAADAGQLVGYLVKRFVPGHALELRGTARPDAAKGPHEAVGAVRPRAHGQPAVARGGGLVRRHARKLAIAQVQLKRAAARAVDGAKRRRTGFGGFASESGIDWLHLTEQLVGYVRDRFHALIIAGRPSRAAACACYCAVIT